jgi:hypothetical protein
VAPLASRACRPATPGDLLDPLPADVGQLVDMRSDRYAVLVVEPSGAPHVVPVAVGEEQCCHVATGPSDPLQRGQQPASVTGPTTVHHRHFGPVLDEDPRRVPRQRVVDTRPELRHLQTYAHLKDSVLLAVVFDSQSRTPGPAGPGDERHSAPRAGASTGYGR